jgi:hypothetical protein
VQHSEFLSNFRKTSTSFSVQPAHFRFSAIPDVSLRRTARRPNWLTRGEARPMMVNFAKLPELLCGPPPISKAARSQPQDAMTDFLTSVRARDGRSDFPLRQREGPQAQSAIMRGLPIGLGGRLPLA